jgi:hypothetical protein
MLLPACWERLLALWLMPAPVSLQVKHVLGAGQLQELCDVVQRGAGGGQTAPGLEMLELIAREVIDIGDTGFVGTERFHGFYHQCALWAGSCDLDLQACFR